MVQVAVMGHGVVGSGVVEVLTSHAESIAKRAKEEINIKYILDIREFPDSPLADRFTKNFEDILNDEEVKVVAEVMGGVNPAYDFVKRCLQAGKSVVTSNKELVAKKGAELLAIAQEKNANFLFEASVGGGIPIIRPMSQCLAANDVIEIAGILNGTTNFILTKMIREQMPFADALKMAQELGYAERNPEADVEGGDACRKIAILTSLAYGKNLDYNRIHTEGITKITTEDFQYAKVMDAAIKLVGTTKEIEGTLYTFVAPMLIGKEHPLAGIDDVFNGVFVHGNVLDDAMFYGRGAGKLPTASAVVADVVDAVKNLGRNVLTIWDEEPLELGDFKDAENKFFVRVSDKVAQIDLLSACAEHSLLRNLFMKIRAVSLIL